MHTARRLTRARALTREEPTQDAAALLAAVAVGAALVLQRAEAARRELKPPKLGGVHGDLDAHLGAEGGEALHRAPRHLRDVLVTPEDDEDEDLRQLAAVLAGWPRMVDLLDLGGAVGRRLALGACQKCMQV